MSTPKIAHHYILTLQQSHPNGALQFVTESDVITVDADWDRISIYSAVYKRLTERAGMTSATVVFWALEPNSLQGATR